MNRVTPRTAVFAAVAALLAGACSGAPSAAPSQGAAVSAQPTAVLATQPPATVVPSVAPSGSPGACPSDPPTVVDSVEDLADPACYGTTELTVDGWLSDIGIDLVEGLWDPTWTMPMAGLYAATPTVGESIFDFLLYDRRAAPRIPVIASPSSGLDILGVGRWVTLRGHFNDPEASACVLAPAPTNEPSEPNPYVPVSTCARSFVATSLVPLDHAAPTCPTESPLNMAAFMAADFTCFAGREVEIRGWEDIGEGFGGTGTTMQVTTGSLELAEAQLVANRWDSSGDDQLAIFPWIAEGSGVRFDREDREVVVTGILGHEAAEACRPMSPWSWAPPDAWAVNRCARLFVITDVRAAG